MVPDIRADCCPDRTTCTSYPHISSSTTSSAPLPQPWHWAGPYSSLSKCLSPVGKYWFVCCGVSELNDSLCVSQQVLELLSGAGLGGRALHTWGSSYSLHQPGLRWQIPTSEQPKLILSLQQPSGLISDAELKQSKIKTSNRKLQLYLPIPAYISMSKPCRDSARPFYKPNTGEESSLIFRGKICIALILYSIELTQADTVEH